MHLVFFGKSGVTHVQMEKNNPEAPTSSLYQIAHGWKNEYGS
jgi:hypothetical protein